MAAETDEQDRVAKSPGVPSMAPVAAAAPTVLARPNSLVRLDFPTGTQAVIDQEFLNLDLSGLPSCPGCQAP